MPLWEHYHLPHTVEDALAHLARYAGAARVVAGGTDLLLEMQQGRKSSVAALVDVTRIPELTRIYADADNIYIGAGVTHTAIVNSPLLVSQATCLVESCGVIGGPQVRNVATLGGNVAHALPAGDGTLSLVALNAEAEVASVRGREWRPTLALFKGPGKTALNPDELIVQFRLRAVTRGEGSAFKRIMRPQGVALPILGLAVWARVSGGVIESARLALGPAGPKPLRLTGAEKFLEGKAWSAELISQVVDLALAEAQLRTSPHRATAEYRRELILPLVERALPLAIQRATTGEVVPEGVGEG
ncbi:MAG: FAD binding domain-containing protein [Anaerolineales bacterium]